MKQRTLVILFVGVLALSATLAAWRTPITKYTAKTPDEHDISRLFIDYITARNNRDVDAFLATLHAECTYMITKDFIASKDQLAAMLPGLWMQNDDNNAAFGHCMAWECWHENYYRHVMLINPKINIMDRQATADFKVVSGLFMDDNYFQLVKGKEGWLISRFMRPIY